MQGGYERSIDRGRSNSSSQQGQGPAQGFPLDRSMRTLPQTGTVMGGDGGLRLAPTSQQPPLEVRGPQRPVRQLGYRQLPPPPINLMPHAMPPSTDMYGGGIALPQGMTPTGPSISWADGDVWAHMGAPTTDFRGTVSQDPSLGGLILSPQMMSLPPHHPMSAMQSPRSNVATLTSNVLAHRQAPTSAQSSNGMFGYSVDFNINDGMQAGTPQFSADQRLPEAGPSSGQPMMSDMMINRYGHRVSNGSIGDGLAMSINDHDDTGEMTSNWIEGDDGRDGDDMLGGQDDELDDDDDDGDTDGRPRKKARNSLRRGTACVRCRSKKLKCTGERPICSVCLHSRKPVECVYQPMAKRKPKTHRLRSRLQELEDQIREKENRLSKLDDPFPDTPLTTQSRLDVISEERDAAASQTIPLKEGKTLSDVHQSRESTQGPGLYASSNVSNMLSNPGHIARRNTKSDGLSLDPGVAVPSEPARGMDENSIHFDTWSGPKRSMGSNQLNIGADAVSSNMAMNRLSTSARVHAQGLSFGPGTVTVIPSSPVEYALIYAVLPYSFYFCMPVHPARFLDSLLPASTQRPHPALLYALFTASIYVLVNKLPPPPEAMSLPSRFPKPDDSIYPLLAGLESSFYNRARTELDLGLQAGDQLDDLTKASVGLAKYLLLTGRVLQAFMLPFVRLAIACGLHRINLPQPTKVKSTSEDPSRANAGDSYSSLTLSSSTAKHQNGGLAHYRPKLVVVPPAQDDVSLWERIETFWAVKELDWGTSLMWGWSCGLADSEIQTAWPKRFEAFTSNDVSDREYRGVWDLMDAKKPPSRDSSDPRVLALQSLSLVSSANRLFDLPTPLSTLTQPVDPNSQHPFTQYSLKKLQRALETFRSSLPDLDNLPDTISSDPWWVFTRANVAAADMLFYAESAVYQPAMYEHAVSAARRMVELIRGIPVDLYAHLNCFVFLDVSLVARFLYREAARLRHTSSNPLAAQTAMADADTLLEALEEKAGKWHPFGLYLAEDIRRVKQGHRERPELYERAL